MRSVLGPLFAVLALGACREEPGPAPLEVYAAASLRDVLQELAPAAERACGSALAFNFGSSGDLARQIVAAGRADLFVSADEQELERVAAAGLVEPGTRRELLSNQLVVVEPLELGSGVAPAPEPFDPAWLASPAVPLLSLANPDTVPAGKYARAWLESRGVWEAVRPRVLPAIDVRAALAAVESGGARAGIVYRTDAARSRRVRVLFAVPRAEGPAITYPLAVLAGRPATASARRLADFLASEEAARVFERHGFVPATRAQ